MTSASLGGLPHEVGDIHHLQEWLGLRLREEEISPFWLYLAVSLPSIQSVPMLTLLYLLHFIVSLMKCYIRADSSQVTYILQSLLCSINKKPLFGTGPQGCINQRLI